MCADAVKKSARGELLNCLGALSFVIPSPPPLDPLPPSPLSSSAAENLGFGNFFW